MSFTPCDLTDQNQGSSPVVICETVMLQITPMSIMDLEDVTAIERASHLEPWSEKAFLDELGILHSRVLVARVIGPPGSGPDRADKRHEDKESGAGDASCDGGMTQSDTDLSDSAQQQPTGSVAGYICFWIVAGELQILNVTVSEAFRRRGIGRALLVHAVRFARRVGARMAFLEVREGNLAARRLYESVGFKCVGERPGYYSVQKEAAILMEMELNDRWMLDAD